MTRVLRTLDARIPAQTVLGNPTPGDGPAQAVPLAAHAASLVATGVVASAGSPANLAQVADGYVLANTSGATAAPTGTGLSALLDHDLGAVQGDVLYRGATVWAVLAPGSAGQFLTANGAAANPSWTTASSASISDFDTATFWATVQNAAATDLGNLEDIVFLPAIDLGAWAGGLGNVATAGFTAVEMGTF